MGSETGTVHRGGQPAGRDGWAAIGALGGGTLALVTTELLPVGLLTQIGEALSQPSGRTGLLVTVPGLLAAVTALFAASATARVDRKTVLGALMAMLAVANLASACASSFAVLLAARVLVGLSIGGFWALAGGLAVRLVAAAHVGRATAVIVGGVAVASVVGVPLGTLIGDVAGWRVAFGVTAILALVVLAALQRWLPPLPAHGGVGLEALVDQLRNSGVRLAIVITFLVVVGHFTAFTYVSPILQQQAGFEASVIGGLLLLYGGAGIIGNFLAGDRAARDPRLVLTVITGSLTVAILLLSAAGPWSVPTVAVVAFWGLAYGAVSVTCQAWVLRAAPDGIESATGLVVAAFNLAIAAGALVGGGVLDRYGPAAVTWLAGSIEVTALAILAGIAPGLSTAFRACRVRVRSGSPTRHGREARAIITVREAPHTRVPRWRRPNVTITSVGSQRTYDARREPTSDALPTLDRHDRCRAR